MKRVINFICAFILCNFFIIIYNNNLKDQVNYSIKEYNACTNITSNVVYYNANIFNYNYVAFNAAARNMTTEQYKALSNEQKVALDTSLALTGPADSRAYVRYIGLGLAKSTLDSNGNVQSTNANKNGVDFFPTESELNRINKLGFGIVYEDYAFNIKFPFLKLSSGHCRFYSTENHLKINQAQKNIEIHDGAAGGYTWGYDHAVTGMWPFNPECWPEGSTTYGNNVFHFGIKITVPFYMTEDGKVVNFDTKQKEDMLFTFLGDDDVWVFVDDKLIVDIGGEHVELEGWVNFATNQSYTDLSGTVTDNAFGPSLLTPGYHTLTIFYMERPGSASNFKADFNLPEVVEYSGTKVWEDNNNEINIRPDSYTLKLYRNGEYQYSKTFTADSWGFTELPKYDASGNIYTYTVQEDTINLSNGDRYEPKIEGTTITNKLIRVPRKIIVKHIDKTTNEVIETEEFQGFVNTEQNTSSKEMLKYRCISSPSQKKIKYTVEDQIVEYYYELIKGKITITKVDKLDNTKYLVGAIFKIEKLDEQGNIDTTFTTQEKATGENGKVEFIDLLVGEYLITEIKAPEGYELSKEPLNVSITKNENEVNLIAIDKLKLELPETGGKGIYLYLIIGFVIIIISAIRHKKIAKK